MPHDTDFLLLSTPTQHAARNPAVELNPRRLRQWLFALPIMNVPETVRQLDARIRPFNEMALAADERLKLLEVLFEAFDEILFSYDDLRLSMLPVTPDERRALAQDIMWLYLQLAAGYKLIVLEHFENGGRGMRDSTVLMALFRAMELLAHALLYAYRAHETPPPLTYLELYQLYHYARRRKLHQQRLRQIRGYAATPTVERLFKQVMLLSIADPYHMSGQAVFENFLLLDSVCDAAEITAPEDCPADRPAFRFVYTEDAPPIHCAFARETPAADEGGVLQVGNVAERLRTLAAEASGHDAQLLTDLARRLGNPQERREARQADARTIHLTTGLHAVRHFLAHPEHIEQVMKAEVHAGIAVMDLDSPEAADCALFPGQVRNISSRGYLLECDPASIPFEPVVGDVLGVVDDKRATDNTVLHLGLARWLKQTDTGRLHLGVEIIPGRPRAVRIHPCNGSQDTLDGFHFAVDREARRPARLLVPAILLGSDERFRVQIDGQAYTIAPRRTILTTEQWLLMTFILQS